MVDNEPCAIIIEPSNNCTVIVCLKAISRCLKRLVSKAISRREVLRHIHIKGLVLFQETLQPAFRQYRGRQEDCYGRHSSLVGCHYALSGR